MRSNFWRCVGGDRRVHELSSVRRSSSSFSFQSSVSSEILLMWQQCMETVSGIKARREAMDREKRLANAPDWRLVLVIHVVARTLVADPQRHVS